MKRKSRFLDGIFIGIAASFLVCLLGVIYVKSSEPKLEGGAYLLQVKGDYQKMIKLEYELSGNDIRILASPDREKIAYAIWENVGYSFYLTNPNGSVLGLISRQHVGEGNGGINIDSFEWTKDSLSIQYTESALACKIEVCRSPGDFASVKYRYTVNVDTGVETREEVVSGGL